MRPLLGELADMLMERWISPEVARREAAGQLDLETACWGFQLIFRGPGEPEVRINEEIMGTFNARPFASQVGLEPGQVVNLDEAMEEILDWRIETDADDVGFVTLYLHREEWNLFFNALHNSVVAKEHLRAAVEFLETAVDALATGRTRAATDTLFSAVELANKAFLFTFPTTVVGKMSHGTIASEFFRLSRFHAFETVYTPCVKRLRDLRPKVRYLTEERPPDLEELREIAGTVESFLAWVQEELDDMQRHKLPKELT